MENWRDKLIQLKGDDGRKKDSIGMTGAELSYALDVSDRAIWYYLSGQRTPHYSVQWLIDELWEARENETKGA
jgi:hypothetical protein